LFRMRRRYRPRALLPSATLFAAGKDPRRSGARHYCVLFRRHDRTRGVNYAQWRSRTDFDAMLPKRVQTSELLHCLRDFRTAGCFREAAILFLDGCVIGRASRI
jgi:hypothetical protein